MKPLFSFLVRTSIALQVRLKYDLGVKTETIKGFTIPLLTGGILIGALAFASPVQAATVITNGDIAYSYQDNTTGTSDVYSVDSTTGANRTDLTQQDGGTNSYNPSYSPDGSKIVYAHVDPDFSQAAI